MMRKSILGSLAIVALLAVGTGCSKNEKTANAEPAKPAQAAAPANPAPAAKPAAAPAAAKPAAAAAKKSIPAEKQSAPVPSDWIEMQDNVRGFSFSVPKGSKDMQETKNGVTMYMAQLPPPNDKIHVVVTAFKNAHKSTEDLMQDAQGLLGALGEKDIQVTNKNELTGDYTLGTFQSTDGTNGEKSKGKILVATDVTDNYLMIVVSPEASFSSNEKVLDAIWGSFDMFSGGFTGESKL